MKIVPKIIRQILCLFTLNYLLLFTNCSPDLPDNWPQCPPHFQPDSLLPNGFPNPCQFVYEGFFDLAKNQSAVNCIQNPTNWQLEQKSSQGESYFEISVFHNPIEWDTLTEGSNYGFCIRNLIFVDENQYCGNHHLIELRWVGIADDNRSFIGLHLPHEFWDCYEEGLIEFRVTAKAEMPIWE